MVKNPPCNGNYRRHQFDYRGHWFNAWSGKTSCQGATKPVSQLLSPCAMTTEACTPRAHAPLQEKPPPREARARDYRVAPTCRNWRKPTHNNEDLEQTKLKKLIKLKKEVGRWACIDMGLGVCRQDTVNLGFMRGSQKTSVCLINSLQWVGPESKPSPRTESVGALILDFSL